MKSRPYKRISEEEKRLIYSDWESGNYYSKELFEKYHITKYKLYKIIEEMRAKKYEQNKI